jgi:hypothetical protein
MFSISSLVRWMKLGRYTRVQFIIYSLSYILKHSLYILVPSMFVGPLLMHCLHWFSVYIKKKMQRISLTREHKIKCNRSTVLEHTFRPSPFQPDKRNKEKNILYYYYNFLRVCIT